MKCTTFAVKEILLLCLFSIHLSSKGQGFLKADGQKIVNEKGENVLLRGIGLGGWMLQEGYMLHLNREGQQYRIRQRMDSLIGKNATDSFYTAWLNNHTTRADIDSLHAWGFNSVRLPMHYRLFTLSPDEEPAAGENTFVNTGFDLTDSLISWCKSRGMYVFLDLHAAPGGQGNDLNISDRDPSKPSLWQSEAAKKKTIALWTKLASRYANEPAVGGYDILNEPNWGFEDTVNDLNGTKEQKNIPLRQLLIAITRAIRSVDQKHLVIIEGNGWGNNYKGVVPPWDGNMVLSFHKYWNYNDEKSIQYILDYRNKYNIPVWLGETGENSNTWFTDAVLLLESHNIGWAWWPLKKLGNNNPLQIASNPAYDSLVDYWNGKNSVAPKNAYAGLMQLAQDSRCEKNIVHRDVIDAMFRQTRDRKNLPFKIHEIPKDPVIWAVDFDLGPNSVAYYDLDTGSYWVSGSKERGGNLGRVYRNDGVDIYPGQNPPFFVGKIESGEWMEYTIRVARQGLYNVNVLVSSDSTGGVFSIETDHNYIATNMAVPLTGGQWKTLTIKNVALESGTLHLKFKAIKGGFRFAQIGFILQ